MMTSKVQELYVAIVQYLLAVVEREFPGEGFAVSTTISDYEPAIQNAMSMAFPNSRVMGCWFHFGQVIILFLI